MRSYVRAAAVALLLLLPLYAFAQRERASIVGRVTDPSGAVIPGVAITVTNVNTGLVSNTQTTGDGIYTIRALPVGTYRMEAKKDGFKTGVAENLQLGVAQQATIDLALEVGAVAEQVTVTAEAPLLETTSPEVGSSMNDKLFHELPIAIGDVRQAQQFIFQSSPGTTGETFSGSINGGQLFSHEILIDGISIARYDISGGSLDEFTPSVDAIGEFKLQANNYSAQYGESSGGIVTFTMKSGTNNFHGSVYEYLRNRVLDAAGWRVNTNAPNGLDAAGNAIKSKNIRNNFGGTFGGPFRIPKLYDGRNKTLFFFAYDGLRAVSEPRGSLITMPTSDQLEGDFSRLLDLTNQIGTDAVGRPIYQGAIYDPGTTRDVVAGQPDPLHPTLTATEDAVVRDAFGFDPLTGAATSTANMVPQSEWSTVSSNIVPFYGDIPLVNDNLFRNVARSGTSSPWINVNTWSLKVDQNINDRHKLSSTFNYNKRPRANGVVYFGGGPINLEQIQSITGRQFRAAWDWTISDHMLNHFAVGYNRFANPNYSKVFEEDWAAQIGLSGATDAHFPQSCFGSSAFGPTPFTLACIGSTTGGLSAHESYIFLDDMSYTRGKHTFKWGFEARAYRSNSREKGGTSGSFSWSNTQTALPGFQGDVEDQAGLFETGWPFASFLLGTAERAGRGVILTQRGTRQRLYVAYFQDDWRATSKLSLSYGLRWDIPAPRTEAYNRISGFDPTVPNPGADNTLGALVFLQEQGRKSFQDRYWRELGPRIGLAYQLNSQTVLRAGYGITYAPPVSNSWGGENGQGFNSSIRVNHNTSDPRYPAAPNPWDPVLNWDNGIPPFQGTLPNTDPASENFGFIDWLRTDSLRQPYVQQWSAGFQRSLPMNSVLEVNYVGNKGTRLMASLFSASGNAAPTRFMSMVDADGNALVAKTFADLTAADWTVLNANGITGKPFPSFPDDIQVAQALKRYPQYDGLNDVYPNFGASTYNSLQVSFRNKSSHGLTFIAAYTFSKTLTNSESGHTYHHYGSPYSGYYNVAQWPENRAIEKAVADFDTPHSLKLTWVYELPFGRGKAFANRGGVVDKIIGGWKITGIQNYLSGTPLIFTSSIGAAIATGAYGTGHWATRPDMVGDWSGISGSIGGPLDPDNGTEYLNVPSTFDADGCKGPFCLVPTSNDGYALHPGNAPRVFGNIRGPGRFFEDFGIIKGIRFTEEARLEIVANFFNVLGRHGFGNPDTFVDSSTFGRVFGTNQGPRSIQFAMRLVF